MRALVAALSLLTLTSIAEAQKRCVRGIPCGNTCIAANKTCRVGTGNATSASNPAPASTVAMSAPGGAQFVASSRGQVYYWIGCSAWKSLATANLIYFKTREAAQAAGYRPSASRGCAGPTGEASAAPEASTAADLDPARVTSGEIDAHCSVARVIDGDTFECSNGNRVRLLLVDAPEMDQGLFGPLAKSKLHELLPVGSIATLELDIQQRDRYGRVLAYAHNGSTFVNRELVRTGMAVVSIYPPNVKHVDVLRAAGDSAKFARAGLWATSAFDCAPADHRAGRCN